MTGVKLHLKLWKLLGKPSIAVYEKCLEVFLKNLPSESPMHQFLKWLKMALQCISSDAIDGSRNWDGPPFENESSTILHPSMTKQQLSVFIKSFQNELGTIHEDVASCVSRLTSTEDTRISTLSTIACGTQQVANACSYRELPLRNANLVTTNGATRSCQDNPGFGSVSSLISMEEAGGTLFFLYYNVRFNILFI